MRGTLRENIKNAIIAVLTGILASQAFTWRSAICQWGGAYCIAEIIWFYLTVCDES